MGHGRRNYLVVAFKDLRGIGRVWGLDNHFPILGKRYVARVLCGSRRIFSIGSDPQVLAFRKHDPGLIFRLGFINPCLVEKLTPQFVIGLPLSASPVHDLTASYVRFRRHCPNFSSDAPGAGEEAGSRVFCD